MRENRGKTVEVVVLRDKKEQTLTLVPDGKKRSSVDYQKEVRLAMVVVRNGFSFTRVRVLDLTGFVVGIYRLDL